MSRRVNLPGADELFGHRKAADDAERNSRESVGVAPPPAVPSGRVRHDEKITIYVTAAELMQLERTRLALRGEHGVAVDRGRLVREAIQLALEDVAAQGDESALVRRLRAR